MREITFNYSSLADLSRKILTNGSSFELKVKGYSMYPFIRESDIITIQSVNSSLLHVGDVVFYERGNTLVVHRIIKKQSVNGAIYFTTRGDACPEDEENITENAVLGKVIRLKRGGKTIQLNCVVSDFLLRFWRISYPLGPLAIKYAAKIKRGLPFIFREKGIP